MPAEEVVGWPWQCWLCGKKGMTTNTDPFTPHNATLRHRLYALVKRKWGARHFTSRGSGRR